MPTSDNYAENLFYGIKSLVVVWRMVGQFACSLTSSFFTLIAANHIWGGRGSNHVGWFYGTLHNWKYARLPKSAAVPRMGLAALYDIQQQYALFTRGSRFMIYNNNVHSSIGSVDLSYTQQQCAMYVHPLETVDFHGTRICNLRQMRFDIIRYICCSRFLVFRAVVKFKIIYGFLKCKYITFV